jgi:6-phosphofructokinase 1
MFSFVKPESRETMNKHIGILTAGGDSPGLNAAIRAIGKTALGTGRIDIVGFRDGFRGLMENRTMRLDREGLSSILTLGGTILGTSRDKPHRMPVGGEVMDMTEVICDNYKRQPRCPGLHVAADPEERLPPSPERFNILTCPNHDNDGHDRPDLRFHTAMEIATRPDRLHSRPTVTDHRRRGDGHNAGWLALGRPARRRCHSHPGDPHDTRTCHPPAPAARHHSQYRGGGEGRSVDDSKKYLILKRKRPGPEEKDARPKKGYGCPAAFDLPEQPYLQLSR